MKKARQALLNAFYVGFTGVMLASFLYAALGAGVSHLHH